MIIATHNGPFHADEVFALAILKTLYPQAEIIRTRKAEELAKADVRIDVGLKYSSETGDFDHHQGNVPERENGIPYASSGLVWKHYGEQFITEENDEEKKKEFIDTMDRHLFQAIDAPDNGIGFPKINDELKPYTISIIIDICNKQWNESAGGQFEKALELAQFIFQREVSATKGHMAGKNVVRTALDKYADKDYFLLEQFVPWKSVAIKESEKLFCVHPGTDGNWNAVAVPVEKGTFENRKDFPKNWAGLEGEALAEVSGVNDAVFCHKGLFIAVAGSKEGAIQLAEQALK